MAATSEGLWPDTELAPTMVSQAGGWAEELDTGQEDLAQAGSRWAALYPSIIGRDHEELLRVMGTLHSCLPKLTQIALANSSPGQEM